MFISLTCFVNIHICMYHVFTFTFTDHVIYIIKTNCNIRMCVCYYFRWVTVTTNMIDRKRRDKFRGERAEANYRGAERTVRPRDDWPER